MTSPFSRPPSVPDPTGRNTGPTTGPTGSSPAPEATSASLPPAGWYPDPAGGAGLRLWDGSTWTAATAPATAPATALAGSPTDPPSTLPPDQRPDQPLDQPLDPYAAAFPAVVAAEGYYETTPPAGSPLGSTSAAPAGSPTREGGADRGPLADPPDPSEGSGGSGAPFFAPDAGVAAAVPPRGGRGARRRPAWLRPTLAVVAVLALLGAASVAVTASRGDGSGSAPPETTSIPAPTTSSTTPAPTTSSTTPAPTTTVPVPSAALTAFCSSATPGPDLQLPAVADTTDPAAAAGALAALRQRYAALAATTTAFLPEASAVLGPQATGLTPEELAATFADAFASLDAAVAANQTLVATSPAPRTPLDWSAAVLAIPPVLTLYATACLPPPAGSAPVGLPACLDAEGVKVPCAVPHSTEVFYLNGPASACADFLAANSPATVVDGAISHPEIAATVSASYGGRLHSCSLSFTAPRTGLFANLGG